LLPCQRTDQDSAVQAERLGEPFVVLDPAGDSHLADQVVASQLLQHRSQLVPVADRYLVQTVQQQGESSVAEPYPADGRWDLVATADLVQQPVDEPREQRAVRRVIGLPPSFRCCPFVPAGQIHQDGNRLVRVKAGLLGQGTSQLEQQGGLARAGSSEDQHGVLQIGEYGQDVRVLDPCAGTVERLDQQVVRADDSLRAFVQSESQPGARRQ
jgi:hypothetical protein